MREPQRRTRTDRGVAHLRGSSATRPLTGQNVTGRKRPLGFLPARSLVRPNLVLERSRSVTRARVRPSPIRTETGRGDYVAQSVSRDSQKCGHDRPAGDRTRMHATDAMAPPMIIEAGSITYSLWSMVTCSLLPGRASCSSPDSPICAFAKTKGMPWPVQVDGRSMS